MKRNLLNLAVAAILPLSVFAQQPKIDNLRPYDQTGINQFETPKQESSEFTGVKVRFGAGFNQGFQALKHSSNNPTLLYPRLASGWAIAQANLYTDVQLADGVLLNLTTYLSARHHNEAWVKGGYVQFDKVPFKGEFWDNLMKNVTVKVGHMEINYGDQHFRRTDGGHAIYNPFIENHIMDQFATEVAGEVYYKLPKFMVMGALSNGLINGGYQEPLVPGTKTGETYKRYPSIYGKVAFDDKLSDNMRVRLAASLYHNNQDGRSTLFGGDRTGSNYFYVMEGTTATAKDNAFSGRVNPGFANQITAMQLNALLTFGGLELFGTFENARGRTFAEKVANFDKRSVNQFVIDAIYRLGKVYAGVRYNTLSGQMLASNATKQTVNRLAVGAGWFPIPNLMVKGEYVNQTYDGYPTANILSGGKFNGVVLNASVGF